MLEITDVVIAFVTASGLSLFLYSSIKKTINSPSVGLTEKRLKRQMRLAKKELWEHAAYICASGISLFLFFVFNAATNLSHYSFWPRLVVSLICFIVLLYLLRLATHYLFRICRDRLGGKSNC